MRQRRRAAAGTRRPPRRATARAGRPARAGVPTKISCVAAKLTSRDARRAGPGGIAPRAAVSSRNTTRSANTRTGVGSSAVRRDRLDDRRRLRGVVRGDEADVGARGDESVGRVAVAERGDDRLALRRPRCDRRALHREPRPPRSRCSAVCLGRRTARWPRRGSRRRPPSCPTAGGAPRRSRRPRRAGRRDRGTSAAEVPCGVGARPTPGPHAGAAGADVVEGRDRPSTRETARCGWRSTVGTRPDVPGAGCDPRRRSAWRRGGRAPGRSDRRHAAGARTAAPARPRW